MKRRQFQGSAAALAAVALGGPLAAVSTGARAQAGAPVEGQHFVRLARPVPGSTPGRIEVVEFFWYECPHCNAFEPLLEAWSRRLGSDVALRRVPVAFRENPFVAQQRLYYALEALGKVEALHRRVFTAIHVERQRLDTPEKITAFMAKNGVDEKTFTDAYNSFGVQTKVRQAKALAEGYKVDGVPAMGVAGRFYTSGTLAGTTERSLAVVDFLVDRVRKGG